MVRVVPAVTQDDMVQQVDVDSLTSLEESAGAVIILTAGQGIATGMVVAEGDDCSVVQHFFSTTRTSTVVLLMPPCATTTCPLTSLWALSASRWHSSTWRSIM